MTPSQPPSSSDHDLLHPDQPATVDRRSGLDRRKLSKAESGYTGPLRRATDTGLELNRGPGRRRSDNRRSAEEGEMTAEQFEFIKAVETYKKVNRKMYPTWTEILDVLNQLGYRKVRHRTIKLENVPEPDLFIPPITPTTPTTSTPPAKQAA